MKALLAGLLCVGLSGCVGMSSTQTLLKHNGVKYVLKEQECEPFPVITYHDGNSTSEKSTTMERPFIYQIWAGDQLCFEEVHGKLRDAVLTPYQDGFIYF